MFCIIDLKNQKKEENNNINLSQRKNKLNIILLSKRKQNNPEVNKEDDIGDYIINLDDINIPPEFKIKDINNFYSNVNKIIY